MILFSIDPNFVTGVSERLRDVKLRMLVGVRLGLKDAVRGLAHAEADAASSHEKTGELRRILESAGKVIETPDRLIAVYRPRSPGKQLHYWLEQGVHVGPVSDRLMALDLGGEKIFRRARKGFDIPARPFFYAAAEEYKAAFFATVQARVQEALQA